MKKLKTIRKNKKTLASFALALMLSFGFVGFNPTVALAEDPVVTTTEDEDETANESGSVGDVDINIGADGKLLVENGGMSKKDGTESWNSIFKKYKFFVIGISGIGTISMILFFIFNFLKLGSASDNDQARGKIIKGLIYSAIAAAGLGGVTIVVGFFYYAMQ